MESSIGETTSNFESRLQNIENQVTDIKSLLEAQEVENIGNLLTASRYRIVQRMERALRGQLNQIQALLQMEQQLRGAVAPLPSTGGWALDAQSLLEIGHMIRKRRPGLVVETGSGASTVWLGYVCAEVGSKLVTLEHDADFASLARTQLQQHGLADAVDCRLAPLEVTPLEGHVTDWYSVSSIRDLHNVDMLIVDGPPATTGENARYPAVPLLLDKLSADCVVVMDDMEREEERVTFERWINLDIGLSPRTVPVPSLGVLVRGDAAY